MTAIKNYRMSVLALLSMIVVLAAMPAYAQTYSVLYNFGSRSGDPKFPDYSGVVAQGRDGSLYTTSTGGGANGSGAIFKITPAGTLKVLYSFCSQTNCTDGQSPYGGLTLRPDGHFIGTTFSGGNGCNGGAFCGTIFDISPTGTLTTLYNFTAGTGGSGPTAPPILGPDGSYYGTTQLGGSNANCGTLYKFTPPSGFEALHIFNGADGCDPGEPLVLGIDENLYGTAISSTPGAGVVFQVILRPGKAALVNVLYRFDGIHGSSPSFSGALVQDSEGNFYGTTDDGGTTGNGVIYKITPAGALTVLFNLNGTTDGYHAYTGLVQASDGNFYGAAEDGGNSSNCTFGITPGCGTLFQVTPAGNFSVLYNFDVTTGSAPLATPFQNTNGVLYGDAYQGGTGSDSSCANGGCGVFYSWNASLPTFVSTVPFMGKVGSFVEILGQGFTSSTTVSFNGKPATATVVSGTYLKVTVPAGATTGFITVTTSGGTLTSNRQFVVTP